MPTEEYSSCFICSVRVLVAITTSRHFSRSRIVFLLSFLNHVSIHLFLGRPRGLQGHHNFGRVIVICTHYVPKSSDLVRIFWSETFPFPPNGSMLNFLLHASVFASDFMFAYQPPNFVFKRSKSSFRYARSRPRFAPICQCSSHCRRVKSTFCFLW